MQVILLSAGQSSLDSKFETSYLRLKSQVSSAKSSHFAQMNGVKSSLFVKSLTRVSPKLKSETFSMCQEVLANILLIMLTIRKLTELTKLVFVVRYMYIFLQIVVK